MSDDIGGRLRRARERRGLSLRDAAGRTKLPIFVLQAIERNDFTSLPAGMFRKAYVRTLAAEVGLDPGAIAADYCAQYEPPIEPAVDDRHRSLQQKVRQQFASRLPRRSTVTLATLAALAAAWFMLQPAAVTRNTARHDVAGESIAAPVARGAAVTPARHDVLEVAPMTTAARAAGVPLRIELVATGLCWIAADTDGTRAMYRLVAPGERVVLEAHRTISLRLGDAGAVTVSINDGPARSLGSDGAVAVLEVTPDNVEGLRASAGATVSDE